MRNIIYISLLLVALAGCSSRSNKSISAESHEAKQLLQGDWVDAESGDVSFRVKGDTIFFSDSTSMPSYFKIVGDSLILGTGTSYYIEKQTEHLFWFNNLTGELIKLKKNDDPDKVTEIIDEAPQPQIYTQQEKSDSVILYNGERYHWYIAVNPTKYKVVKHSYNNDGLEVDNVYYDNIMHISVYHGKIQVFSSDFKKQDYSRLVPKDFMTEAIFSNMEYSHIDSDGLHFNATLCIPDGASCYMIESTISFAGQMTMKVLEN